MEEQTPTDLNDALKLLLDEHYKHQPEAGTPELNAGIPPPKTSAQTGVVKRKLMPAEDQVDEERRNKMLFSLYMKDIQKGMLQDRLDFRNEILKIERKSADIKIDMHQQIAEIKAKSRSDYDREGKGEVDMGKAAGTPYSYKRFYDRG